MENCDDCVWLPFLVYVSINLTLVGVAAAAVFIEVRLKQEEMSAKQSPACCRRIGYTRSEMLSQRP